MPERSNPICNCLAIRMAARHVTAFYDRSLAPIGLRTTQFSILSHLARLGPRGINELAAVMAMDRTTMGRNIRPLERDGLVAITIDPRDKRGRALSLTADGMRRLADGRALWADAQAQFESSFGAEPSRHLRDALAAVLACDLSPA